MTLAASVGFASSWGAPIAGGAVALAVAIGAIYWVRSGIRERWVRASVVALRTAFVLIVGLLLADPIVTGDARPRPVVAVVWDETASLDVADSTGQTKRRDALARALDAAALGGAYDLVDAEPGRDANATLVITDGLGDPTLLDSLRGRVVAVVPARDAEVPDVAVVRVGAPSRGVTGAPLQIDVTIRSLGAAGRRAIVTISDASHVLNSAAHEVASADDVTTLGMTVSVEGDGWQRLVVEVAGVTGEQETANNRFETWIDLRQPERRVLFLESQPSWEGKFVRRALEEDPTYRVDYVARVSRAAELAQPTTGGDPASPKESAPQGASSVRGAVADAARLDRYDAIVVGPLDASELGDADIARLSAFVSARGGGLVVLGGNSYAGSILSTRGALADLLPAPIPSSSLGAARGTRDGDGTVLLRPAAGMDAHPAFAALGAEPIKALERLQRLGSDFLRLGPVKPGAVVLAEDGSARGESKPPLVVAQPYGAGRVVLVAPQDTWKLAVGAPADEVEASAGFWTGLVAWTAGGAERPVSLRAVVARAPSGRPLRADLAVRTPSFEPVRSTTVSARCELVTPDRPDAKATPVDVAFVPSPDSPGLYQAWFSPSEPGSWVLTADVNGEAAEAAFQVVDASSDRTRPDPIRASTFAAAVAARGGSVVRSDQPEAISAALGQLGSDGAPSSIRPARSLALAFLLPLLFCAEIFLRQWFGVD